MRHEVALPGERALVSASLARLKAGAEKRSRGSKPAVSDYEEASPKANE